MRIDARTHPESRIYRVYHAELMRFLRGVVWVDDVTNQYGEWTSFRQIRTIQAKKILIDVPGKLIIINPIADDTDDHVVSRREREKA